MQIRSSSGKVILILAVGSETNIEIASAYGSVLNVEFSENGFFTAHHEVWVGRDIWEAFIDDLQKCEKMRHGTARFHGFDPDTEQIALEVEIASLNGWGHFGLRYTLTKTDFSSATLWENTLSDGFDVDMEFFAQMVGEVAGLLTKAKRAKPHA